MKRLEPVLLLMMLCVGALLFLNGRMATAEDVEIPAAFLENPDNITMGSILWARRCRFCHGKETYPGAAPPLQPWKYKPAFVYDRITNGWRGMPALKEEFSEAERKAIVAFVLSRQFAP